MTKTTIIIKPGSKWRTRDLFAAVFTVKTVSRDIVRVSCGAATHRFSRSLFGKSWGYLPVTTITPAQVRK